MSTVRWLGLCLVASVCLSCSAGDGEVAEPLESSTPPSAQNTLTQVRARFGRYLDQDQYLWAEPELDDDQSRTALVTPAPAPERPHISIGDRARDGVTMRDARGASFRFRLLGAGDGEKRTVGGTAVYPRAGGARDHLVRAGTWGFEDFIHYPERPNDSGARYVIELGDDVAGLRHVGEALELVDASGTPRFRMERPYVVDATHRTVDAKVRVLDCDYDTDPAGPWGRPVTPPGSHECTIEVSWPDAELSYPLLLDPPWFVTNMIYSRADAGSAVLNNGQVIVVGGSRPQDDRGRSACDLFDPSTRTWASTDALEQGRKNHAVAIWAGSFVYAIGGESDGTVFDSFELYVTGFNTWGTQSDTLSQARRRPTAQVLYKSGAGYVVVAGASSGKTTDFINVFSSDVEQGQDTSAFRTLGPVSAVNSNSRSMVVCGGSSTNARCERFDWDEASNPHLDSWTQTSAAPFLMSGGAVMARAPGSKVAVVYETNAALYDFDDDTWTALPAPPHGASYTRSAFGNFSEITDQTPSEWLVLAGSAESGDERKAGVLQVTGSSGQWWPISDLGAGRAYSSVGQLGDGLLVIGGRQGSNWRPSAPIFEFQANGTSCSYDGECESKHCVDGKCCNSACAGTCKACSASKKGQGSDGVCGNIAADLPEDSGACDGPNPCTQLGTCNGSGGCQAKNDGETCGSSSCTGDNQNNRVCDNDDCVDQFVDCDEYSCGGGACLTSCGTTDDCAPGYICNGSSCVTQPGLGESCNDTSECTGSFICVDGVCCENACDGECEACTMALRGDSVADGSCGPIQPSEGMQTECSGDTSPCGNTGLCSGTPNGCEKQPSSLACGQASCTSDQSASNQLFCDGQGSCNRNVNTLCGAYRCVGETCATTCSTSAECTDGYWCDGNQCVEKLPNGSACTDNDECDDGFCVEEAGQRVCCDDPCGDCQSCFQLFNGVQDGLCRDVQVGEDPNDFCAATASTTCGLKGGCDGGGSCQFWDQGTTCGTGTTCDVGNIVKGEVCDGAGSCGPSPMGGQACDPYLCKGSGCANPCTTGDDCIPGHYCDGGNCRPLEPNGSPCTDTAQCSSGICTDGVCCDVACTSLCFACSSAKKGQGEDGVCEPIKDATDPDEECSKEASSSCGQNGFCDGSGSCAQYADTTACGTLRCIGNSAIGQLCDGAGVCRTNDSGIDCGAYKCIEDFGCPTTCASVSDCANATDYVCVGGQCIEKQENGTACDNDLGCVSGTCSDGVCCDEVCNDSCEACNLEGAEGTCTVLPSGESPQEGHAACNGSEAPCAGVCDGSSRACSYADATTQCAGTRCEGSVLERNACNGQGECVAEPARDCGTYACDEDAGECMSSCAGADDCATGSECNLDSNECVQTDATCRDTTTVLRADGTEVDCSPYECRDGACRESCDTEADCIDDYECVSGSCRTADEGAGGATASSGTKAKNDSGCGCTIPRRDGPAPTWLLLLLAAPLLRRIRRSQMGRCA